MIPRADKLAVWVFALGLASCADPQPTPFAPENQPAAVQARKKKAAPPPEPAPPEEPRRGRVTRMPLGNLFQRQQAGTALIYDVRPAFVHAFGHIPGAISWPKADFEKNLAAREAEIRAAAEAGKPVVLYCTDLACPDAREVAERLAQRGHNVAVLEGGWDAWKAGDLPTS